MIDREGRARFDSDVVVVTGSTRGIGAETARRFATEEAAVVVTGRTTDDGQALVTDIQDTGGTARFVESDLREPDDIAALFEETINEFGGIDILVNNASVQTETAADEATIANWERVLETDFRSYWLCSKHASEQMDSGVIINISSNHAFSTMPAHFPYNAVKAGINGMTRAMAVDLGPNIRVNTVNPGWVAVERTLEQMDDGYRDYLEEIHPVGRIGHPEDVAGTVAFLASDDAAFITGASLLVDGGRGAVMQDDTVPDYSKQ